MVEARGFVDGHILVVAFEGWNDAGEAASGTVRRLQSELELEPVTSLDPELYFDYQFNRPTLSIDEDGNRRLTWPEATMYGPVGAGPGNAENIYVLLGTEPSRSWKNFTSEVVDAALAADISGIVFLGAMLADVPHTRSTPVFTTSDDADVRTALGVERSSYEGPVGIMSAITEAAAAVGIPTVSVWASVPHYVHNAPSPKATLALIGKLEELIGVPIPRDSLADEASAWENGIDQLAAEDEDMAAYIHQLEQARDTVDSPDASGEAIAKEFERYLRRRGDGRDGPPFGR